MEKERRDRAGALLQSRRSTAIERAAALDRDLAALALDRRDGTADDEHDPEGVPLSEEWSRMSAVRREVGEELDEIDSAFERLAAGSYGVCVRCGAQIPIERLEARPFTQFCVHCAS